MNKSSIQFLLSLSILFVGQFSHGYKILYLLPSTSKSHKNVFNQLIIELATRGHEVTVIAPFPLPKPVSNVKEIVIETNHKEDVNLMKGFMRYQRYHPLLTGTFLKRFSLSACEIYLKNMEVKKLIALGKQFDVAIVNALHNECALATAPLLANYIIMQSPVGLIPWNPLFVPQPPSYVPHMYQPYTSKMNFFQRLNNIVTAIGFKLLYSYFLVPAMQDVVSECVVENPSIQTAHEVVSFTLTNADPILITARPTMPNIVNVGGMHCRKANPLPKDLENFIQQTGNDGFVYFSLGSNDYFKYLSMKQKISFLNAFTKLKQKILVNYEEKLENIPNNVKFVKQALHQDIIGHSKIKAFISYGDLCSLQEALYHGVPIIGIPVIADEYTNVARIDEFEIGIKLDLNSISGDSIVKAMEKILLPKYKENIMIYSSIFRDHYQHPVKLAAFWVEYVVRHKGAKHLRSPGEHLNFFQYFLLDIIGLILLILLSGLWVLVSFVKFILMRCKTPKPTKHTEKKKQ